MYTFEFFPDTGQVKEKILMWADSYQQVCFLDSNNFSSPYSSFNLIAGFGCVDEIKTDVDCLPALQAFYNNHIEHKKNYLFGFISYDLKNEIEKLTSGNSDQVEFPLVHFFVPEIIIEMMNGRLKILVHDSSSQNPKGIFHKIMSETLSYGTKNSPVTLFPKISRQEYLDTVKKIKQHIQLGDVYELNYCQEFYCENTRLDPVAVFEKLNALSPAPMSCFYKCENHYLLSTSPERFLKKTGSTILSQPMKGTVARGKTTEEDENLRQMLYNDEKERSENVMIVDLVRNDLSRIALDGSVRVDELYGIQTFSKVHQMVSTVSCTAAEATLFTDILKAVFPMGSMTGAPKIRAMQLIEHYEKTKRGLFSGSVGYVFPDGDFDFNVVIRSLLYNKSKKYLSLCVGGAITSKSVPEKEYEECLLKARAIKEAIGSI